jgi:nucleotide-binding universal stress UspA family protein
MNHRLLVALDHSTTTQRVFDEAIALGRALKSDLLLLHVLSTGEDGSPKTPLLPIPDYYPGFSEPAMELFEKEWKAYEAKGMEMLQDYRQKAIAEGLKADCQQIDGGTGRTICGAAKDWQASLIVLGRRGHTGLGEWLIGSTSNYVLHHAPCSVYVVNLTVAG